VLHLETGSVEAGWNPRKTPAEDPLRVSAADNRSDRRLGTPIVSIEKRPLRAMEAYAEAKRREAEEAP
jgi:hypothetical protein